MDKHYSKENVNFRTMHRISRISGTEWESYISWFLSELKLAQNAQELEELVRSQMNEIRNRDSLTGLYNRECLMKRLSDRDDQRCMAFIGMDIDNFNLCNEFRGYGESDELLCRTADNISAEVAQNRDGEVFRLSGNRFLLVLYDVDRDTAYDTAEKIRIRISGTELNTASPQIPLTVSCGIVMYPEDISEQDELLGCVERAIYYAKSRGKNQTALWSREEDRRAEGYETAFESVAATIYSLTAAIDAKDQITFRHSMKVSEYAAALARALEMKPEEVELLREAGLLHDIGKISIPESILKKQSYLTDEEYEVMKTHVVNGVKIIRYLPDMEYVIPAVMGHHERYDGKGYPSGLAGDKIPLLARCLVIADSFETMTAARHYKDAMSVDYAVRELERGKGSQFDPYLTDVFLALVKTDKVRVV